MMAIRDWIIAQVIAALALIVHLFYVVWTNALPFIALHWH